MIFVQVGGGNLLVGDCGCHVMFLCVHNVDICLMRACSFVYAFVSLYFYNLW